MIYQTIILFLLAFTGSVIAQNTKEFSIIDMNLLFSETTYQLDKIYIRGSIQEDQFDFRYLLGFGDDEGIDLREMVREMPVRVILLLYMTALSYSFNSSTRCANSNLISNSLTNIFPHRHQNIQNLEVTSLDRTFNVEFGISVNEPFPQLQSDERPPSRPTLDDYPELLEPMDDPDDEAQREFDIQWDEWRSSNSFTLAGPLKFDVAYVAPDRYVSFLQHCWGFF